MASVRHALPGSERAKCLVVFLPGAGDTAGHFEQHGFVDAIRKRGLSVDMVAANATLGYYVNGTVVERVQQDVLAPELARGPYEQTWLIGMSMGGLGTIYVSHDHPEEITGVLSLAPFLGDDDVINEIRSAGGVAKWKAPERVSKMTSANYQRELWRWLQATTEGREKGPVLHLGFGTEDGLAKTDEVLAAALPPERVYRVPGLHKWVTWLAVLERFLDESEFSKTCR